MSEWRWRPATYNNPAGFHGFGPDEEKAALKEGLLTPDRARYQVRQRFELFLHCFINDGFTKTGSGQT